MVLFIGLFNRQSIEVYLALDVDCVSLDEVLLLEETLRHKSREPTCNVHLRVRLLEGGTLQVR